MENTVQMSTTSFYSSSKGIIYALIVLIGNGIHPIINASRPDDLSSLNLVFLMSLWELFACIPFLFHELKSKKNDSLNNDGIKMNIQNRWFKYRWLVLVLVGLIFSVATYLYVEGLTRAGSISGSIALKSSPIYAMIIGILFLKEKFDIKLILLTLFTLFGLYYLGTQGSMMLDDFSIGFIMCLTAPFLWSIGHALSKNLLENNFVTPSQVIFFRTSIIFIVIFAFAIIVNGWTQTISSFVRFNHLIFGGLMGIIYLFMHLSWYNSLKLIDLSYASSLVTPSPAITSLLAIIFLKEQLHLYHIIGMIIMFTGLYLIIYMKKKSDKKNEMRLD